MTEPAIILGTFADFKTVKTRSVVQLIVEVPIERGKQVVEAFGFPQPGAEVPVAVTRVKDGIVAEQPKAPKPKRAFADMPPSQQAGIMCNDSAFQKWADIFCQTPDAARTVILNTCEISSRKQLDDNAGARSAWCLMLAEFYADTGRTTEQRG